MENIIYFAFTVLVLVGTWKTFEKAGQPGWGAIIPIYNVYLMCLIAGKPGWWTILFFIPLGDAEGPICCYLFLLYEFFCTS